MALWRNITRQVELQAESMRQVLGEQILDESLSPQSKDKDEEQMHHEQLIAGTYLNHLLSLAFC